MFISLLYDSSGLLLYTGKVFYATKTGDGLPIKNNPNNVTFALREEIKPDEMIVRYNYAILF
jgi:hypothetical protein